MYLDFYQLKKSPFHITPDPEFLFLSPSHREALGTVIYGIEERKGFVAIIGEVGLGKTTILRSYLERVDPKQVKTIYILNPNVSFAELMRTMYREFGLEPHTGDLLEMVNYLYQVLLAEHHAGRNVVLVIDEAQNMPIETLENLRMLSNLETATAKLIQIVLAGQPEFEQKLNLYALRQLRQRIAIRTTISPLSPAESLTYIHHRLAKVATRRSPIFTTGALKRIVKQAQGVPRVLNILCDNALISGFGYQQKPISTKIVKEVIADFEEKKRSPLWRWGLACATGLALVVGFLWFSPYKNSVLAKMETLGLSQATQLIPMTFRTHKESLLSEVPSISAQQASSADTPAKGASAQEEKEPSSPLVQDPAIQKEDKPSVSPREDDFLPVRSEPLAEKAQVLKETENSLQKEAYRVDSSKKSLVEASVQQTRPSILVTRIVQEGDYLNKLAIETYGVVNNTVIEWIKKHNPHIRDVNRISVGEKIIFPALPPTSE